jgi:cell division protein ZapA (FtsZ GTPase activity inhibitor)
MQTVFTILDQQVALDCADAERRRVEDLARALEARLGGFASEPDAQRRLILTALALLDEAQTTSAALARARAEIERLTDMVIDARLEAQGSGDTSVRGGVGALRRVAEGAA